MNYKSVIIVLFLFILISNALAQTPTIEMDISLSSEYVPIMIHEEWSLFDMHSASVKRYTEISNLNLTYLGFSENFPVSSERDLWDYSQYDITNQYSDPFSENEGILLKRQWYVEKTYVSNSTKLVTETPFIEIRNQSHSVILEEFHISNFLKYTGPSINFIGMNKSDFWFPFDSYDFFRNLSKVNFPYSYSSKITVPSLMSFSLYYELNGTRVPGRIEGVFTTERDFQPYLKNRLTGERKNLSRIGIVVSTPLFRKISGSYRDEKGQSILIPTTYMVSADNPFGNFSHFPQNLNVVGVEIQRPMALKMFFFLISSLIFLLSFLYARSLYKKEQKHVEYMTGYVVLITLQQGLVSITAVARPYDTITIFDLTTLIPILGFFVFYLTRYFKQVKRLLFIFLKFSYDLFCFIVWVLKTMFRFTYFKLKAKIKNKLFKSKNKA